MKKKKIRHYIVLERAQGLLCWTATTQTPVSLLHEDTRPCWWLHTGSTQSPIIPTGYEPRTTLGPKAYLSTLLVLRSYSTKWLVNRRILVEHTSCEMHPSSAAIRHTGWIIRRNWMTSYSSTAVLYGTYCKGKRGQGSTCLFQMT